MEINGQSIIQHVIRRLKGSRHVSQFILATTTLPEDDATAAHCEKIGVTCYRGSDWDVLDRFYQAAQLLPEKPTHIVRICCDNPTHHFEVMDYTIDHILKYDLDYFSNGNQGPDFYEDGITSEVFSYKALEEAQKNAILMSEREHVTPYIKLSGHYSLGWRKYDAAYTFKLSVDTQEDLDMTSNVFAKLGDDFTVEQLVQLFQAHPEMLEANKGRAFNEGYQKSIAEDRKVK